MEQNQVLQRKAPVLKDSLHSRKQSQPKYFSNLSTTRDRDPASIQTHMLNSSRGILNKSQRWITNNSSTKGPHEKSTSISTFKECIVHPIHDLKSNSEYVTAQNKPTQDDSNLIKQLQSQLAMLKASMQVEIEDLKSRLTLCESSNQQILSHLKNAYQSQQQSGNPTPILTPNTDSNINSNQVTNPKHQQHENVIADAIAEEYKSKRREIKEFSYRQEVAPQVGFNIKEFQKHAVKGKHSQQHKKAIQVIKAPQIKQSQSFLMRTPENIKRNQNAIDKNTNHQLEEELIDTDPVALRMELKPQESPFRGFQNSTNAHPIKVDKNSISKALQSSNPYTNRTTVQNAKPISSISSLPQSPIPSHRDKDKLKGIRIMNSSLIGDKQKNRDQLSKSQLGISVAPENPKFLEFVKENTSRQSNAFDLIKSIFTKKKDSLPSNLNTPKPNPLITQNSSSHPTLTNQYEEQKDLSPSYFYQKWLDITSKERTRESDQSTERGDKPTIRNRDAMAESRQINDMGEQRMDQSSSSMEEDDMDQDDCDEKRSYTPEPKHANYLMSQPAKSLNHSIIGLKSQPSTTQNVNSVYTSSKMDISKYIAHNKSAVDHKNKYNILQYGGKQALIESKGSKCTCNKNGKDKEKPKVGNCGAFCKQLNPCEQKRMILECIQKELNVMNTSQLTKSGQKLKKYLIDGKWWRKWCDYVNFDSSNLNASLDTIQAQIDELQTKKRDSKVSRIYDSSTLYCKPERICNENLIDKTQKGHLLRENLVEHFDFESLTPLIWTHLYSWYSADQQIARYLKKDKLNTHSFMLELYPDANKSFLGYNSTESENSSEDSDPNDRASPTYRDQIASPGGTPEIKIVHSQNKSTLGFNRQSQNNNQQQKKTSFFGISIPQRSVLGWKGLGEL